MQVSFFYSAIDPLIYVSLVFTYFSIAIIYRTQWSINPILEIHHITWIPMDFYYFIFYLFILPWMVEGVNVNDTKSHSLVFVFFFNFIVLCLWQVCYNHIYIYIYSHKWSTTQVAQISQKQDGRNIYAIMKTMCPPSYCHNGFVATHAIKHTMYVTQCWSQWTKECSTSKTKNIT